VAALPVAFTGATDIGSDVKLALSVALPLVFIVLGVLVVMWARGHCKRGEESPEAGQTEVESQPQVERPAAGAVSDTQED
jgi:hypothetical protein